MASMEDLIATISGGMHVSQEGYDLKALQEYLSRTIVLPNVVSPGGAYGYAPGPSSRATSVTRKPHSTGSINHNGVDMSSSLYSSEYSTDAKGMYQPYPSPIATVAEDPLPQPHRPASLRRSSSYGFSNMAGPSSPYMEYSSFETDAFAPLTQTKEQASANMWGVPEKPKVNSWGAFQTSGAFGNQWAGKSVWDTSRAPTIGNSGYRPPTPPDEDDEMMDEDEVDGAMDEAEERQVGQAHQPAPSSQGMNAALGADERISGQMQDWERGRRKQ